MSIEPITIHHGSNAPVTGPVVCAPWCEDGGGHMNVSAAEDQFCCGESVQHPLNLENQVVWGVDDIRPATMNVWLQRYPRDDTRVIVQINEDWSVDLTPKEAEWLGRALCDFAKTALKGPRGV
jgi:hypothetical protein